MEKDELKGENFTPKNDIDEYLYEGDYLDLNLLYYEELENLNSEIAKSENTDSLVILEPLYFFNLVYKQLDIIEANKDKPTNVLKHLRELELDKNQRYLFLKFLIDLTERGDELSSCNYFIQMEANRLESSAFVAKEDQAELTPNPNQTSYTNSQLVLIFYYFLKYTGIEPRVQIDIAPIAKFMHLITGKDLTAVANSDFYKKLQKVPNFKKDKELIKDLQIVKPLFMKVQLSEVAKMIDNEIEIARAQLRQK